MFARYDCSIVKKSLVFYGEVGMYGGSGEVVMYFGLFFRVVSGGWVFYVSLIDSLSFVMTIEF